MTDKLVSVSRTAVSECWCNYTGGRVRRFPAEPSLRRGSGSEAGVHKLLWAPRAEEPCIGIDAPDTRDGCFIHDLRNVWFVFIDPPNVPLLTARPESPPELSGAPSCVHLPVSTSAGDAVGQADPEGLGPPRAWGTVSSTAPSPGSWHCPLPRLLAFHGSLLFLPCVHTAARCLVASPATS